VAVAGKLVANNQRAINVRTERLYAAGNLDFEQIIETLRGRAISRCLIVRRWKWSPSCAMKIAAAQQMIRTLEEMPPRACRASPSEYLRY